MSGIGGQSKRKTESQILQQLRKYLPDRLTRSRKMTFVDTSRYGESPRWEKLQRAGWLLPTLEECRLAFEVKTGMPRDWPEPLSVRKPETVALPMGEHEEAVAEEAAV
jgi:hypothetical protein